MTDKENPDLISIGEAAKILGVSHQTLRRLDSQGKLAVTRSGAKGKRFFSRRELQNYQENRLFSISEAAELLNLSIAQIRQLEDEGELIPTRTTAGQRQYDKKSLENWKKQPAKTQIHKKQVVLAPLGAASKKASQGSSWVAQIAFILMALFLAGVLGTSAYQSLPKDKITVIYNKAQQIALQPLSSPTPEPATEVA